MSTSRSPSNQLHRSIVRKGTPATTRWGRSSPARPGSRTTKRSSPRRRTPRPGHRPVQVHRRHRARWAGKRRRLLGPSYPARPGSRTRPRSPCPRSTSRSLSPSRVRGPYRNRKERIIGDHPLGAEASQPVQVLVPDHGIICWEGTDVHILVPVQVRRIDIKGAGWCWPPPAAAQSCRPQVLVPGNGVVQPVGRHHVKIGVPVQVGKIHGVGAHCLRRDNLLRGPNWAFRVPKANSAM